jgi:hypothetical protein
MYDYISANSKIEKINMETKKKLDAYYELNYL